MKNSIFFLVTVLFTVSCSNQGGSTAGDRTSRTLSTSELQDKIRGGWAGQVIGCTYGGPTEFRYQGRMIPDDQSIPWDSTRVAWYFENGPGLYDDVYMDLTFMEVMEKEGIDAPASSHARAFANAPYPLWHANQAARYNILHGIEPPGSGFWKNNPHADDIDFQIEADFAGLMSPGMPNTAAAICDRIGHIMNYGDGWYGGVYMAAMYSLAFISDDVEYVVTEGLKAIPDSSSFHRCLADVVGAYRQNPDDWKAAWSVVEKNWNADTGCPDGVFRPFNIDAKVNAAYVAIGLLYGKGDFAKTIDIATRCGQDSDCNPASAGGILGTIRGYSGIPAIWTDALKPVADKPFSYTPLSLNRVYETGYRQALEQIGREGGGMKGDSVKLPVQKIRPVALEVSFPGMAPAERRPIQTDLKDTLGIDFEGSGFVLTGGPVPVDNTGNGDPGCRISLEIDGNPAETILMPANGHDRRLEIAWRYDLEPGKHHLSIRYLNPAEGRTVRVNDLITYNPYL